MNVYSCMMMNHILGCFIFLALVKHLSCSAPFKVEDNALTAKEGSCTKLTCTVISSVSDHQAYWFWMKDAEWIEKQKKYEGTIVYSTNEAERPVSPEFAGRVQYVGSPSSDWNKSYPQEPECSILICNLNKNDSGQYSFRFIGPSGHIWKTKQNIPLTVKDNPCPITFEKQPALKENDTTTLTCSTLSSCPSNLQILDLSNLPQTQFDHNNTHKSTSVSFTATWKDDGRVVTCQEQNNMDKYLMKNIRITVEYPPTEISSTKSSDNIKEKDSVTLTCSAKGNPSPTFTWFRVNGSRESAIASWTIPSVSEQHSGQYYCQAENRLGQRRSNSVTVNVKFPPDVEIKTSSPLTELREGHKVTLMCHVKRSNPKPHTYKWEKDGKSISTGPEYVRRLFPNDTGQYRCKATNTEGTGTSEQLKIQVHFRPRKPQISPSESKVRVRGSLELTCNADAHPAPDRYFWYRYNHQQTDSSWWTSTFTDDNSLYLNNVQRADKACYTCNASNSIGAGPNSDGTCIEVLYPPTEPVLSMAAEVTENQTVTISCSVESFPSSTLSLSRTSTPNAQPQQLSSSGSEGSRLYQPSNQLNYTFIAMSGDAGHYSCKASNSEGSNQTSKTLVVKYAPKDMAIKGEVDVEENQSLTLSCTATSHKQEMTFSWMKDGKEGSDLSWKSQDFRVKAVSPSDSGTYRCSASNDIGTTWSQAAEVKVKYAPKHTRIIQSTEQQLSNGRTYVTLNCSAQCHPPVTQYLWYREEKRSQRLQPRWMHDGQTLTVFADQPGVYYCVAKNEINEKQSDPIHLFDGTTFSTFLKLALCLGLLILIIIVLVYRYRKHNSSHRGTLRHFLFWSTAARRGSATQGTYLAEPSRSRDDLLPDQSHRPEALQRLPAPDSTPASDVSTVYSVVKLAPQKQAASAQKPTGRQDGLTAADSPNYASLHFGKKTNNKQLKPTEDDIYAKVNKSNPHKKNAKERLTDYENIRTTAKAPNPLDDDTTDSSDDDVQLNYAQVSFTVNPGHQRPSRDSSSSDDYEIQYSDIKI